MHRHLVLASGSPRRSHLLEEAGFEFEIDAPHVDERPRPGEEPTAMVVRLSRDKASAVAPRHSAHACVLACDTTVVLDGAIVGKPNDAEHAVEMLLAIGGRPHTVVSGYTILVHGREPIAGAVVSEVHMAPISRDAAAAYVATGEPLDKAGAYGIQGLGRRFVDHFEGSFTNIMGLPVETVVPLLRRVGVSPASPQRRTV